MRHFSLVVVFAVLAVTGCKAPVPRGHFFLPEDSFLTTKRVEGLVPPGTPIEKAREVMELHGFACTFEEVLGIPHLQCTQLKRFRLWPFEGVWMATIYFEHDLVTSVQARFDENPYERGVRVPKRTAPAAKSIGQAKDAHEQAAPLGESMPMDATVMPFSTMIDASAAVTEEAIGAAPAAEPVPPASVPVEVP